MKFIGYAILTILCLTSCTSELKKTPTTPFDALVGKWARVNDEAGKATFENWQKENSKLYIGQGYTLEGIDTVFKEDIKILYQDSIWIFEVSGVHEEAVPFKIDRHDGTSFSFTNETNPFPKKIAYNISENKLQAIISGGTDKIVFNFEKMD